MKIKLYLKLALKIAIVSLITITTLEYMFRAYNKINPTFIFSTKSYNRFRGKPFSRSYDFRLNSKGFKDVEHAKDKKQHIFRIIGIGDSFVFGVVPYKYNFLTLLEKKLNEKKEQYEVINMGIPYAGVEDYFALLINEGVTMKPDLIICCFFLGNDFEDQIKKYTAFYVPSFLKYLFNIYPTYKGNVYNPPTYQDDEPTFNNQKFLEIERQRSLIFQKKNEDFPKRLDWAVSYLKLMKNTCASHHMQFLVVIIPDELQINVHLQKDVVKSFSILSLENFDFELPNRTLEAKLDKLGIMYIDLLNDFMAQSRIKRCYKPRDTHWNIAGNELASELIFNKIIALMPDS